MERDDNSIKNHRAPVQGEFRMSRLPLIAEDKMTDAQRAALKIVTGWGRYEKTESAHETTPTGKPRRVWKRNAKGGQVKLGLVEGSVRETPDPSQNEVRLEGRIRKSSRGWVVTLFLRMSSSSRT